MSSVASINSHRHAEPKIDSAIAKYTTKGDLLCVLCGKVIKPASLKLWNAHLVSVKHKEMVASLRSSVSNKKEKTDTAQSTQQPEPLDNTMNTEPSKPLKSILKSKRRPSEEPIFFTKTPPVASSTSNADQNVIREDNIIPFKVPKVDVESSVSSSNAMTSSDAVISEEAMDESQDEPSAHVSELPPGFFDDPKLDAKARNVEFVDPMEKELQEFQKIIQQEETAAESIELEETTLMLREREIEQIEGQMSYFARAANIFEQKRQQDNQNSPAKQGISKGCAPEYENVTANMDTREVIAHFLKLENDSKPEERKERMPYGDNDDVVSKVTSGMRESIIPDSIYAKNFVKEEASDSEDENELAELNFVNWRKKSIITNK